MPQYLLFDLEVKDHTVLSILLVDWAPVFLSVGIGAFVVNKLSQRYQKRQEFNKRKFEIAEEIALDFQALRSSWRRLKTISDHLANLHNAELAIPKEQNERKERYIEARDSARDRLEGNLKVANLYFSRDLKRLVDEFQRWDYRSNRNHYHKKTSDGEWELWAEKLVSVMKRELE